MAENLHLHTSYLFKMIGQVSNYLNVIRLFTKLMDLYKKLKEEEKTRRIIGGKRLSAGYWQTGRPQYNLLRYVELRYHDNSSFKKLYTYPED